MALSVTTAEDRAQSFWPILIGDTLHFASDKRGGLFPGDALVLADAAVLGIDLFGIAAGLPIYAL
jgi:hypothetical protein